MHPDLERLARVDSLDRERRALQQALDNLAAQHAAARAEVAAQNLRVKEAQQAIEAAREEERAHSRREHQYQQRRSSALRILETGSGDPDAAQRQLDQCDEILDEIETAQLELMERQDRLERDLTLAQADAAEAAKQLAHADATFPTRQNETQLLLQQRTQQREAELAHLDPQTRDRYDLLVTRRGTAVAHIDGGACTACRMVIQTQHLADLRRGLIAPCRGCNRWLIPPPTEAPAA